jgi:hypothetical protein
MQTEVEVMTERPKVHTIHIFVEFSKTDHRKVEFDTDHVTGAQIKAKAGAPLNSDLGRRVQGKIEFIPDDQLIEIKNGDHFVVLPAGTIS